MSQIYNDNTKRPKPKENQLGILGISSREFTAQEPWHPGKGAKLDHVVQLNCREVCTQKKQPEHGRTSTTKEQKWYSFQMNYDQ